MDKKIVWLCSSLNQNGPTEKVQKQHYSNILEVYPFPYVQKFGHATPITVAM